MGGPQPQAGKNPPAEGGEVAPEEGKQGQEVVGGREPVGEKAVDGPAAVKDRRAEAVQASVDERQDERVKANLFKTYPGLEQKSIEKMEQINGVYVFHCNNVYQYLKAAMSEDAAKLDSYKDFFELASSPRREDVEKAMGMMAAVDDAEKKWLNERINASGSAVKVEGMDEKVVIMNAAPSRRLFTIKRKGFPFFKKPALVLRTEKEQQVFDSGYKEDLAHEIQHVKFYEWRSKDLEQIGAADGSELGQEYYSIELFTKDEVIAHMHNSLTSKGGIDWSGIVKNLTEKEVYEREVVKGKGGKKRYRETVRELVKEAKKIYGSLTRKGVKPSEMTPEQRNRLFYGVTLALINYHPKAYRDLPKI